VDRRAYLHATFGALAACSSANGIRLPPLSPNLNRKENEIVIAHLDEHGAVYLHERGYELAKRPFDTRKEAEAEKKLWSELLNTKKPNE
jgi:hypothetical protein